MKAIEVRSVHFEKYVIFENNIRKLCQTIGIKTQNVSLRDSIAQLSNSKMFPSLKIASKRLKEQLQVRNWLAHMHSNTNVPENFIDKMNQIEKINKILEDAILEIKNAASESGRANEP